MSEPYRDENKPAIPAILFAGLALIAVLAFFVAYMGGMVKAFRDDPQTLAGAQHVAGIDTSASALASVTTGAKPVPANETATTNPGQPASPQR